MLIFKIFTFQTLLHLWGFGETAQVIDEDVPTAIVADHVLKFTKIGTARVKMGTGQFLVDVPLKSAVCGIYELNDQMIKWSLGNVQQATVQAVQMIQMSPIHEQTEALVEAMGLTSQMQCDHKKLVSQHQFEDLPEPAAQIAEPLPTPARFSQILKTLADDRVVSTVKTIAKNKIVRKAAGKAAKSILKRKIPRLPNPSPFASLAMKIFSFVGGNALTQFQMDKLRDQINTNTDQINQIAVHVQRHETELHNFNLRQKKFLNYTIENFGRINTKVELEKQVNNARSTFSHIRHIANVLRDGRLEAALIHPETMKTMLTSLKLQAQHKSLHIPELSAEILGQLPTSYSFDGENLSIYVSIPLTNAKWDMTIYKFSQLPFQVEDQWVELQTSKSYLMTATGPSGIFTTMTEAQFRDCQIIGGTHICDLQPIIKKAESSLEGVDEDRCLHAAHKKHFFSLKRVCTLQPATTTEKVVALGNNQFGLYTRTETTVTITCPNLELPSYAVQGLALIYLPAGCHADTHASYFWGTTLIGPEITIMGSSTIGDAIIKHLRTLPKDDIYQMLLGAGTLDNSTAATATVITSLHKAEVEGRIFWTAICSYIAMALSILGYLWTMLRTSNDRLKVTDRLRAAAKACAALEDGTASTKGGENRDSFALKSFPSDSDLTKDNENKPRDYKQLNEDAHRV